MSTDIIATVTANPVTVLIDEKTYSDFYQHMKAECDAFVPDLSTVTSRAKISAQAYKVTRTKTAIDAAGKKLNEEARAKINVVDASRKKIRDELDALADEVRKPLTDWEEAEKERLESIVSFDRRIDGMSAIGAADRDPPDTIRQAISEVEALEIDPEIFRDQLNRKLQDKANAIDLLGKALDRAIQREADAAELSRLRAEAEARAEADRIAKDAEEEAERNRIRQQRIDAEYAENVKREAEAAAKLRREQADREAKAIEAARQEALAKSQREHAEQMAKIEAENKRLADAERDRLAKIAKDEADEKARQADRARQSKVMGETKTALMELGADEEAAKKIVLALRAGDVPHAKWVL